MTHTKPVSPQARYDLFKTQVKRLGVKTLVVLFTLLATLDAIGLLGAF